MSSDAVAPLARGLLLVSTSADFAGSDPLGLGFPIYVGIDGSQVSYPLLHEWNGSPTQPGHAAARFAIPNRPQLVGTTFYMQGIFVERHACAAAPFGMSSTDAVAVTIQPQ